MNLDPELLILPDGRVLIHNLDPGTAAVLLELAGDDPLARRRLETMLMLKKPAESRPAPSAEPNQP